MRINKIFAPFVEIAKLRATLNKANVNDLTKVEIKEKTRSFSKGKVLAYKIKLFKKLAKKADDTMEAHLQLKQNATKLGLRFNRNTRKLIKEHYADIAFFNKQIEQIQTSKVKLNKGEICYLELGKGSFTDIPHIIQFKLRRYNNLVITNKRLITVFNKFKNSYYYDSYSFLVNKKMIIMRCKNYKKPTIYLFPKTKDRLANHLKHILKDRP